MNILDIRPSPPGLAELRTIWPVALLLVAVAVSYDTAVVDLSATKRAVFQLSVGLWGIIASALAIFRASSRPALGLVFVVVAWAFVPAAVTGLPVPNLLDKPIYFGFLALAYVLLRARLTSISAWGPLVWLLSGIAAWLAISAIIELALTGGDPHFGGAPHVTTGNPNHLAAALLLLLPAPLAATNARRGHNVALVVVGLAAAGIAISGSHLGIFGLCAIVGIVMANPGQPLKRRIAIVAILGAATLAGLGFAKGAVADADLNQEDTAASALEGRLYLTARSLDVIQSAPLWGVGVGEFPWAFAQAQSDHLAATPDDGHFHTRLEHAHNDPLELLGEFGVLGVATLILLLLAITRAARTRPGRLRRGETDHAPIFAVTGLSIFVLISIAHFALFSPFIALLGLTYLACIPARRRELQPQVERALCFCAVVLIALGAAITIRAYQGERLLVDGLRAMEDGDLELAEDRLAESQRAHPTGRVVFHRGTIALADGRMDEAGELLALAAYLLPYAEVHHNYAVALCQAGLVDEGVERFEHALYLDPGYERSRAALATCADADSGGEVPVDYDAEKD